MKDPANYQGFDPELVGRQHHIVLGKHSGTRAVQLVMSELGHPLAEGAARELLRRVKLFVASRKHSPTAADLLALLGAKP
jgi:homocitrate synthase NifV